MQVTEGERIRPLQIDPASLSGYLASGGLDWPPLAKSRGLSGLLKAYETSAEPNSPPSLNLGARSAPRRAKRGRRRKAPGAVRRPRAARGPPRKARMRLNCRDSAAAYKHPGSAGTCALHMRDLDASLTEQASQLVLCVLCKWPTVW